MNLKRFRLFLKVAFIEVNAGYFFFKISGVTDAVLTKKKFKLTVYHSRVQESVNYLVLAFKESFNVKLHFGFDQRVEFLF